MNDTRDMERLLAEWLSTSAPDGAPEEAIENAIKATGQRRPRPTWLTILRTPPMTTERHSMVGSPTARLAYLTTLLVLATAIASAGLVAGAQLVARADEPAIANGLIAFEAEGDIWLADPDGSDVRRLTDTPEAERSPYWSPDGSRLAYLVDREDGTSDIVHTDSAGGDRLVVAHSVPDPGFNHQSWSPDGTRLTYSRLVQGGTWRVFVAQSDGSGAEQVGDSKLLARDPAWSPDGRSIAFQGGSAMVEPVEPTDQPKRGIYVMGTDGSDPRLVSRITGPSLESFWVPLWSPDSSRVATYVGEGYEHDIWVFEADGQGETMVSDGVSGNFLATWSPDGRRIAWVHGSSGVGVHPAFAAPDGSDVRILREVDIDFWDAPVWSPDGTRVIVHLGPTQAGNDLGIVDPEGQEPMTVISVSRPGGVSWQPILP